MTRTRQKIDRWPRATVRALCCALALLLPLSACTSEPSGTTVIEFWGMGREGELIDELLPQFYAENPGIRVRTQQIPWTAAHEKLLTAFVGESTPDVSQMGNTWVPEFEAIGAIAPLDDRLLASTIVDIEGYFPGIWQTNIVDGHLYGVPWYVDTRLIFYRTDIFAEAGWSEPPKSWSEWVRLMDVIREKKLAEWPAYLATNEWQPPVLLGLQTGSPILNERGTHGVFSQPEFKEAFTFYTGLFAQGYAPKLSYNQISNVYQQFAEKDFAMIITGPWNVGEFRRRLPEDLQDDWSTAAVPGPDGQPYPGTSLAGGSSIVIFARSEKQDASWKLLEFLSRPDIQLKFYEMSGNLPARREAWESEVFRADPAMRAFRTQLENVTPTPKVPEWEQIASEVWEHAEMVIRGNVPVDRALELLDRSTDSILEKRRWMLEQKEQP